MSDKFLNLLGIAQRAGALISGTLPCTQSLKRQKGVLLIVALDAAQEVVDDARRLADRAGIPVLSYASKVALGMAIGKSPRVLILVTDRGFGTRLLQLGQER